MSGSDSSPNFKPLHLIPTPATSRFKIMVRLIQNPELRKRLTLAAKKRKSHTPMHSKTKRAVKIPPAPSVRKLMTPSLAKAMSKPPTVIHCSPESLSKK